MASSGTNDITPLGFHNFRGNREKRFGIKPDDRRRHIYVVGKTGVGKSTLLENMAIADIQSGKGIAIIDPHGELAEKMLDFVPEERLNDVIYFDPSDMEHPFAFNPMEQVGTEFRHLVASGIMSVFKKIWIDAWSARMEYILNNTLLALLEYPDSTLLGILRMFAEPEYRKKIVQGLQDPVIKAFWQNEFARYSQRLETEALAAIQNKVGQFVSNPLIRNILGQSRSTLNMREIMDSGKIFIVNLSKGKMGEDNSTLLGAMIITRLQLAAMSRVDVSEEKRRDFFMYVDEFQNFATESFASILSEARKYHLSLTLAHQYIGQLVTSDGNTKVRDAVFGNVGTIITFRIGAADAEFLEKEFMPEFVQQDLVNLAKANVYIKLMIDGVASRPFSAETLPPQHAPLVTLRDVIIKNSNDRYATPRSVVEKKIASEWETPSEENLGEKMDRRGEKRLSEVLRRDGEPSVQGRPPQQRRFDDGPRPPRQDYGPRNDNRQAPRPFRSEQRPTTYNDRPRLQPQQQSQPQPQPQYQSQPQPQYQPQARPDVEAQIQPQPEPQSRPQPEYQPQQRPAPAKESPIVVKVEASASIQGVPSVSSEVRNTEKAVEYREKSEVVRSLPPRDPRPASRPAPALPDNPRNESEEENSWVPLRPQNRTEVPEESEPPVSVEKAESAPEENSGERSFQSLRQSPAPVLPVKKFPKQTVDIGALRRAINESLKKQAEKSSREEADKANNNAGSSDTTSSNQ